MGEQLPLPAGSQQMQLHLRSRIPSCISSTITLNSTHTIILRTRVSSYPKILLLPNPSSSTYRKATTVSARLIYPAPLIPSQNTSHVPSRFPPPSCLPPRVGTAFLQSPGENALQYASEVRWCTFIWNLMHWVVLSCVCLVGERESVCVCKSNIPEKET